MDDRIIYRILESRMLSYEDYRDVPVEENNEPMVPIIGCSALSSLLIREDAVPVTGQRTYVRAGVLERLQQAADMLSQYSAELALDVGYGYRSLAVQTERFEQALHRVPDDQVADPEQRRATAHRQIAVPELAGHPAGAAVDVRVVRAGQSLEFGTELWSYEEGLDGKKIYTFAPSISNEARKNRFVLRRVMLAAGFAPYDGEWWHFSYGDKEWAKYYERPNAIYDQLEFRAPEITTV